MNLSSVVKKMTESMKMCHFLSDMDSVEHKTKGGYHGPNDIRNLIVTMNSFAPYDSKKEFLKFTPIAKKIYPQSYNMSRVERDPSPQPQEIVTKNNSIVNNQQCSKKKKKKRRRKKKKNRNNVTMKSEETVIDNPKRRQRQFSTTSEDSFTIAFDEDCTESCLIINLSQYETETIEDVYSSDSTVVQKKVRFADNGDLCEVHPMVMWSYAYQAARKGPWEECARDRERFHQRVVSVETKIGHVFSSKHRARIYNERFA